MSAAWAGAGATVAWRRMESREEEKKKKTSLETGDALLKKKWRGGESDYRDLHLFFKANISVEIPEAERK